MVNQNTRDLVYLSLFFTIIFILSSVPNLGYITIPGLGFSTTIVHIPVIIAAIFFGKKIGSLTGLMFGISSLVLSYLRATTPFDLLFQNPLISVVPRFAFAFLTSYLFVIISKIVKNQVVATFVTALLASLLHATLVLGTIGFIFYPKLSELGIIQNSNMKLALLFVASLTGVTTIINAVLGAIIATPIIQALRVISPKKTNEKLVLDDYNI